MAGTRERPSEHGRSLVSEVTAKARNVNLNRASRPPRILPARYLILVKPETVLLLGYHF